MSGFQREALALYRAALRVARAKGPAHSAERLHIQQLARSTFETNAKRVGKRDFQRAEHLIRQAKKQIELLKSDAVSGVSTLNFKKPV